MLRVVWRIALGLSFAVYGACSFVRGAVPLVVDAFLRHEFVDEEFAQFMAVAMVIFSAFLLSAGVHLIRKGFTLISAARRPKQQSKDAATPT